MSKKKKTKKEKEKKNDKIKEKEKLKANKKKIILYSIPFVLLIGAIVLLVIFGSISNRNIEQITIREYIDDNIESYRETKDALVYTGVRAIEDCGRRQNVLIKDLRECVYLRLSDEGINPEALTVQEKDDILRGLIELCDEIDKLYLPERPETGSDYCRSLAMTVFRYVPEDFNEIIKNPSVRNWVLRFYYDEEEYCNLIDDIKLRTYCIEINKN